MLSIPIGYNLLTRAVMAAGIVLTTWVWQPAAAQAAPAAYRSELAGQDPHAVAAASLPTSASPRKRVRRGTAEPRTNTSSFTVTPTAVGTSSEPLAIEKRSPAPRDLPTITPETGRLDWRLIESFTNHALLLDDTEVKRAGRVIQTVKGDLLIKPGDLFFCQAPGYNAGDSVALVRPSQRLKRSKQTSDQGYAAERLGLAKVVQAGPVATLELLSSRQEILPGTWVVNNPADDYTTLDTSPAPADTTGEVIGVIGNHPVGVTNSVIAIAMDETTPLQRGHMISIISPPVTVPVPAQFDPEPSSLLNRAPPATVTLPSTEQAKAVVLSVKGQTALAIITDAREPVRAGAPLGSVTMQPKQAPTP